MLMLGSPFATAVNSFELTEAVHYGLDYGTQYPGWNLGRHPCGLWAGHPRQAISQKLSGLPFKLEWLLSDVLYRFVQPLDTLGLQEGGYSRRSCFSRLMGSAVTSARK